MAAPAVKHRSLTPWLVALACLGPFALALALFYGPWGVAWLPQLPGSREPLAPPVALPLAWQEPSGEAPAWQLIYAKITPCEQSCLRHLGRLLQVQLALGRDRERVHRVFWHVGDAPPLEDPNLTMRNLDDGVGRELVAALGDERLREGHVYVADPYGSVILGYPPDVEQKELLRDLKRLLAGSN